ncbi:MAG: CAP domain-containing protein [Pyrinomonadaceae bacterium]
MIIKSRSFLLTRFVVVLLVLPACGLVVNAQEAKKAGAPTYLSSLEAEVIQEINLARAHPEKYVAYLQEYKKYYNGKICSSPTRARPVMTSEGVAAIDEAIRFLKSSNPLGQLEPSRGLSLGARDHVLDLSQKGMISHRGSDGSLPTDRVSRYGTWESTMGEAILFEVSTPREMVMQLIIDDGVRDRGHRKDVFEPSFQVAGVSIVPKGGFGGFCVIDFADGFTENTSDKPGAPGTPRL